MKGMRESNIPVPSAFKSAAQFIINTDLHRFFLQEDLNIKELKRLARELKEWGFDIENEQSFKLAASERIFYEIQKIAFADFSLEKLDMLNQIFDTLSTISVELDIWKSQNLYFSMMNGFNKGEWVFSSDEWRNKFIKLGKYLKIRMIVKEVEA